MVNKSNTKSAPLKTFDLGNTAERLGPSNDRNGQRSVGVCAVIQSDKSHGQMLHKLCGIKFMN